MNTRSALLIVDVQQGIFAIPDNRVYNEDRLLDNIEQLISKARERDIPVIYVQHQDDDDLVKGTTGWEIHSRVAPLATDTVVHKKYSDAFFQTDLDRILKKKGINQMIMAGLQTEFCIDTTCRRAFSMGYDVILARDAHSTVDGKVLKAPDIVRHHNQIFDGRFARTHTTDECIRIMGEKK